MKKCTKCKEEKELSEFYKHKNTKDKLFPNCKECERKRGREYHREYRKTDKYKEYKERTSIWRKKYSKKYNKKRTSTEDYRKWIREYMGEYRKKPDVRKKVLCRQATTKFIRNGFLIKQPCEVCGEVKVDAHHEDYKKPLEVVWLCREHHKELHNKKLLKNL